jgi:hypothetical protein
MQVTVYNDLCVVLASFLGLRGLEAGVLCC